MLEQFPLSVLVDSVASDYSKTLQPKPVKNVIQTVFANTVKATVQNAIQVTLTTEPAKHALLVLLITVMSATTRPPKSAQNALLAILLLT